MIQYQDQQLTVFESALFRTTSTLYHNEDLLLLVDPTWLPHEVYAIQAAVKALPEQLPLYLLFTHSDYDHIIAAALFPEAQTIASTAFVANEGKAAILRQIQAFDESYYVQRNYPIRYPEIHHPISQEGQQLTIGQTTLTFYQAPGHNADGLFTIVEPAGLWIVGDYLSNIEFPYIYHSSKAYETTLAKVDQLLERHAFRYLIPGHGDLTDSRQEVEQRKRESLEYIHRLRDSLQKGSTFDLAQLWERYDFPAGMLPFHEGNVKLMQKELV